MLRVNVSISNVSAERFLDIRRPIPPVKINTNLNLVEVEKKEEDLLEVPFVLNINYAPSVAQISLKGRAYVSGEKDEIRKIYEGSKAKKPPPPIIMQSIANVVFVESVLISRTIKVPPPIPLPKIPQAKKPSKFPSGPDYRA
jgi:hypothetical protein